MRPAYVEVLSVIPGDRIGTVSTGAPRVKYWERTMEPGCEPAVRVPVAGPCLLRFLLADDPIGVLSPFEISVTREDLQRAKSHEGEAAAWLVPSRIDLDLVVE